MNLPILTLVLVFAIASLTFKKTIASLISFALMMFVLGLYYIYLDEKLLGLFQIFVYTGGIAVLMLFGVTLIGTEHPTVKANPWTALMAFAIFVFLSAMFLNSGDSLVKNTPQIVEKKELFATSYSDFVIIFALIGSSLLYGTIKMIRVLNPKRRKNV